MEMINWMIEKVAGSFFNMPCRDADPFGQQCDRLLPKIGTKPRSKYLAHLTAWWPDILDTC